MNKPKFRDTAQKIKGHIKKAVAKFAGTKGSRADSRTEKPFGASRPASGKGKDATNDRSK
jgi:uncharacterized protein YjbJ (UPF0337 family)